MSLATTKLPSNGPQVKTDAKPLPPSPHAPVLQRFGGGGSRITHHASRSTLHAFTLIELLVVIAIIAILAALVFPVTGAVKKGNIIRRTTAELEQLVTAIEAYKAKTGFYPPDNPDDYARHQLYFELAGTLLTNDVNGATYQTLDGGSGIANRDISSPTAGFGPKVTGLLNASKGGGGDDVSQGKNFLPGWKAAQLGGLVTNRPYVVKVLVGPVAWPIPKTPNPLPNAPGTNPWRYNSSSPTNNSGSYDLWIDFYIGDKLYRMGNWSKQPLNP